MDRFNFDKSRWCDGVWELQTNELEICIDIDRAYRGPVDALNENGWSPSNLDKSSPLFIPKKIRKVAEKMYAEWFPAEMVLVCPFCGHNKVKQDSSSGAHEVGCDNCGASMWGSTPGDAVRKWNRRARGT